jgi:hypothetical protein
MKKVFAIAAVASMAVLASCGNAEDLAKKMQDSIAKADSMLQVQMAAAADSTKNADSIAAEKLLLILLLLLLTLIQLLRS